MSLDITIYIYIYIYYDDANIELYDTKYSYIIKLLHILVWYIKNNNNHK